MDVNFIVRPAKREDCQQLFQLTQKLAEFGNCNSKLSPEILEHDGFESSPPMFSCLVAELRDTDSLCGYALYYPIYSGREGKAMWLEDIFVDPEQRGKGIGAQLFCKVAQEANKRDMCRMDFSVYSWNPAAKFYSQLGADNISETEQWTLWRVNKDGLAALANQDKA